jgi:hypothetical protein
MSFEAAKCPSCNASIQVPNDREKAVCMYCGNILVVKDAIQRLKVELNGPVVVDQNIETLIKSANGFIQLEKWEDAMKKFEKVIEQDSTDYRGWWGKFLVRTNNLTTFNSFDSKIDISDANAAIRMAPSSLKTELVKTLEEYVQKNPKECVLSFERQKKFEGLAFKYMQIKINNAEPFQIMMGETLKIPALEGKYEIVITCFTSVSRISVDIHENQTLFIHMNFMKKILVDVN